MATIQFCSSPLTSPNQSSSPKRLSSSNNNYHQLFFSRRTCALSLAFLAVAPSSASPFELGFTAPDQTVEEAAAMVQSHAQDLLQIKSFIESQSWRQAQVALRQSSAYLKQDLYTLIQGKPASQRPQLRKLYTDLFNNVSKLDYAARSKDGNVVKACYHNIVATLGEILSMI